MLAQKDKEEAAFKQEKRFDNTRILHALDHRYHDSVLNRDMEGRIVGVVMEKKKRYQQLV